tara:strand:+ start:5871 stop:6083 length:213 start_codon:yes stop_codon:yes gene_type:complete
MEMLLLLVGILFFIAVGYFSYTFGQCLAKFSRLDLFINQKFFGVALLAFYMFFVYSNQKELTEVLMATLK